MPYTPLDQTRVLWDERGRPYWLSVDGKTRHFVPPIVAGQYRDDPRLLEWAASQGVTPEDPNGNVPGGGFLRGRGQWNSEKGQYDRPLNGGNLLSLGVGGLMAAPFVLPALGIGGGTSAASAAPAAGAGLTEGLSMATPAAIASQGASAAGAAAPLGGYAVGNLNDKVDDLMADGGGWGGTIKDFFTDPKNLIGLGSVVGGLVSGRGNQQDTEQMERIQQITEAQMRRADPLHQAAVQLAFGRMPMNYRQGIELKNVPLPG